MTSLGFDLEALTQKYGVSVPRYTSYPTAPEWKDPYSQNKYLEAIARSNSEGKDYSIYLHIPFCESQCYFCGCNVIISKEHGIENQYLEKLKSELSYYGDLISSKRQVAQMAWGGGTPTFLKPEQILDLASHIKKNFSLKTGSNLINEHEYSIEIDPRVTTKDHLQALYESGFNRLSMGLQDFNPQTQEAINRIQSYELTTNLIEAARQIGFKSINVDLIYGLPYQTLETFTQTLKQIHELNPERIALFNYAHIPSIFPFQQKYIDDSTLPDQKEKLKIFEKAVTEFISAGYEFIGLDHFARPEDGLTKAHKEKSLYRNFQGYTTHAGCDLFGFGVTAISDVQGVYKQNPKKLNKYYENFQSGDKFLICSHEDIERRSIIKELMCNSYAELDLLKYSEELKLLETYISDGLVNWDYLRTPTMSDDWATQLIEKVERFLDQKKIYLQITDKGRFFTRNIASCFDTYLRQENSHKTFSKAL